MCKKFQLCVIFNRFIITIGFFLLYFPANNWLETKYNTCLDSNLYYTVSTESINNKRIPIIPKVVQSKFPESNNLYNK